MSQIDLLPQVKQLLEQATSQDPVAIKSAEANLAACAEKWQIVPSLAQVYGDLTLAPQIRLAATLQLKHALDRHWKIRGGELGEQGKSIVKELFATTLLTEQNATVAMQASVIAAKIIRKDGNGSWPGLFNQLQAALGSTEDTSKHHAAMALKELIKMMKSKRLPADRKAFYQVAENLWPLAMELWVSTQKSLESSTDQHQFQCRLATTRFALKIIKCLATHGTQSPGDCPKVRVLVGHLMDQMPLLLAQFNTLQGSIGQTDGDAFEKLVTLHAKVIALLAEDYHTAMNGIQERLLQFAAEVVTQGKTKYATIPSRFLVKLMIIIKQFSAIARDPYVKEEEAATPAQLEAKQLAAKFYNEQNLTVLVRFLIRDYLQLGARELEAWESSPEEYISEEQQEVWKYDIRPCSEVLLLSLVHHYQAALVPLLVNMVSEVQNSILPACVNEGELSSNVLIADAVLNAIGLTSYELSDQVDFDSWFQSTLMPLMASKTTSKILKRRVSWLISQWVCVKFAPERRPALYELVLKMMSGGEDLVVRLESAMLLKTAIDDYKYEPSQFVDLQQTACTSLFNLLTECEECDTKMRVLYIYSLILKRQRGLMSLSIAQLSEYLPTLWAHAEQHHLLRGAIVCLLLELTLSVTSQSTNLYNLLIPILSTSCNPHSEFYIYLADDGLDLWLAVLQTAPALTAELLGLIEFIPSILQAGAENLKICFKILDCYLLLDIYQFTASPWFAAVCTMLSESFDEFTEDSQLLIVKFIGAYNLAAHAQTVAQLPGPMLQLLSHAVGLINVSIGPVLRSCVYSLVAHSMCYYKDSVAVQILENVNRHEFIGKWCLAMDSITHHDRRKISALLFIELLRGGLLEAGQMMNPIICSIVEVLSDIGIRKVGSQVEDNLILTADERTKITSKSHPAEPAELWIDLRKQRVQLTNSAYTANLVQLICELLSEETMGQAYRATVDSAVRTQLENLLTGTTEGWGTSDTGKDKLFTQTGGERLTTDSWH